MKKFSYLILLAVAGCITKSTNKVPVYLENNSETDSIINIKTLINGKFYKDVPVKRNPIADRYEKLMVEWPDTMDSTVLTFIIKETGDSTRCVLHRDSLNPKTWVHVNFSEAIFKKGSKLYDVILSSDSVVKHEFYSEVINR
ncbi:hypothetical protein [Niastella populi]|uniref:Lipoprotein n=1 Tax=Niastella populi TaxID=550983 RepID=A0A1V9ENI7_9BACT|nr:hypothetical protein [Niastella populi]OQP47723.1 hypothetical protein A4R26_31935 [Niastella populi]